MGEPDFPREENACDRQWRTSRLRQRIHWPWISVPFWIILPLGFIVYTAPVAAVLLAGAWLVFGVPFWLAWLLVDAGFSSTSSAAACASATRSAPAGRDAED